MKIGEKKHTRIVGLEQQALRGKFTEGGKFSYSKLVAAAESMGISKSTAKNYADEVIERLQKGGHLAE